MDSRRNNRAEMQIPEKGREGMRLLNARCSDCQNLEPGNWCKAKRRTVPGSRHLRKCDLFQQGNPNPPPVRRGKPQHPDLVQCVTCGNFAGWGLCAAGVGALSGELMPRNWRRCADYLPADPTGACSVCRCLVKRVCVISGFAVTQPDSPTSCWEFFYKSASIS